LSAANASAATAEELKNFFNLHWYSTAANSKQVLSVGSPQQIERSRQLTVEIGVPEVIAGNDRIVVTTIRSQAKELGEHAARAAISLLEGKPVGIRRRVIPLELIVRESCGAANRRNAGNERPRGRAKL
jgi:Periplasmic binding protein-like domain